METILYYWPWFGLGLAAILLIVLVVKKGEAVSQFYWWLAASFPIYMLHQFEEHGVDLLGRPFEFYHHFCGLLGFHGDLSNCPATPLFLMMVNVGTVWILGVCSWLFASRRPFIGAALNGLVLTNGLLHIGAGFKFFAYNPGLATSIVIFLPVSLWTYYLSIKQKALSISQVLLSVGSGLLIHLILMGSVKASQFGWIGEYALSGIQILNGLIPIGLAFLFPPFDPLKGAGSRLEA